MLVTLLLFTSGYTRDGAPDSGIILGDCETKGLAELNRMEAIDIFEQLQRGYDPNGDDGSDPMLNYWRKWTVQCPKRGIESTVVDGKPVQLLFWSLRSCKIERYHALMVDDVFFGSIWLKQGRLATFVVRCINDGG